MVAFQKTGTQRPIVLVIITQPHQSIKRFNNAILQAILQTILRTILQMILVHPTLDIFNMTSNKPMRTITAGLWCGH